MSKIFLRHTLTKKNIEKKREPYIDASNHVSFHLSKRLQRRRFLEIDQSETRIACSGHVI